MKRKPMLAPRNPHVAASLFRKVGAHKKSTKALRAQDKLKTQREASLVAPGTWLLPRHRVGSNPPPPTIQKSVKLAHSSVGRANGC